MVLLPADYLRQKFIEPLKERQKEEGRAEGRAEMREQFLNWLRRREKAELEGREFNEPMPGAEKNGRANRKSDSD